MAEYTLEDAETVLRYFRKHITPNAFLIGAHSKGKESDHDIDVYLPGLEKEKMLVVKISLILQSNSYVHTDWGGVYYKDTMFGDVDVFFKGCTDKFDY